MKIRIKGVLENKSVSKGFVHEIIIRGMSEDVVERTQDKLAIGWLRQQYGDITTLKKLEVEFLPNIVEELWV